MSEFAICPIKIIYIIPLNANVMLLLQNLLILHRLKVTVLIYCLKVV